METCANKTCICRQSSRNQSRSPTFQFYVLPGKQGSQLGSTFPIEKKILPVGTETRLGCGPGSRHPSCFSHKVTHKVTKAYCPLQHRVHAHQVQGPEQCWRKTPRSSPWHQLCCNPPAQHAAPHPCFPVEMQLQPEVPVLKPEYEWKLLLECDEAADCLNTGVYNEGSREPGLPWRKWEVAFCIESCCIILVHFVEPS